ncbi:MAG: hypothetical protein ACFCVG_00015 [Kineosporiaceae bacterium]
MTTTTSRTRLADVRSRLPRTLTSGLDTLRGEVGRQLADPTPAYAALGAGDVVARRVGEAARHGAALAQRVRRDGGSDAGHLPRLAVGRALTLAGKVEEAYDGMANRGRDVARRARGGRPTSELVRLAVLALDRARRAGEERRPTVVVGETVPAQAGPDAAEPAPSTGPQAPEAEAGAAAQPAAVPAVDRTATKAAKPAASAGTARRTAARTTAAKAAKAVPATPGTDGTPGA